MLYGDFSAVDLFAGHRALFEALTFWRDRAAGMEDGRVDLPDGMYAMTKQYRPAPAEQRRYETHVKYADIQCVLEGEELLFVRPVTGLKVMEDALAERDVAFYEQPDDGATELPCLLRPGYFVLLYPEDAHKPECRVKAENARKLVIKIPMTLLR